MYKRLERLRYWCQKVIPLVYDQSLSYYELLGKVIDYLNQMIENQDHMYNIINQHQIDIDQLKKDVEWLFNEIEKVKNGDYLDLYLDSLINWIDSNIQELVGRIVKYVYFGLTADGYFVAYIPPAWEFITFDTIMDYDSDLYGHLTLRW